MNNYCEFEQMETLKKNSKIKIDTKTKEFGTTITNINLLDSEYAKKLEKNVGFYSNIFCEDYDFLTNNHFEFLVDTLKNEIENMFKKIKVKTNGKFFVVGLGNSLITADTLGIEVCKKIITTSMNLENSNLSKNNFGNVFSLCPSVASQNGIYTLNIIKALAKQEKPDLIILVDSLSCKDMKFIAKTFQINSCGLTPGCEVNNKQPRIDKSALDFPVISIGCPVVSNLMNVTKNKLDDKILTLKDIDIVIKKLSNIISFALNKIIHKNLRNEEIIFLSKN